ncbi:MULTISPECIES: HEPN domain-containing protein [unclassified Sphingopyxis]|uniref:HEPN domain-containing protein n=1 Tax=unclassified Sphingopyxis TaxID=2614943 RepID=UPI002859E365|nr:MULTISPECIES: HEPN domain-containing protein [unclassified Sphingopyxis]MDR7061617.1 putative nucleotidyltransferase/HEPN domain-containing protein [Sphingopyxis sp. BE235]MDR7182438.1 putative nucleotidyltransferase/HEPN domain-containing protein [Sphingopyxis sp. BE249]
MKSGIDHLPPHKQRELERVVEIIFEEFEDALALATQGWKKKGRISKIILYGSYARGGWVDEPHTAKGYQSDYDLLIIVNDKRLTDRADYWSKLDDRLIRERSVTKTLRTPVNFIVHSLDEVNSGLSQGRYFFMDVARDGIAIYQAVDDELPEPQPKTPHAALEMAREYFDEWFPSGGEFFDNYSFNLAKGRLNNAAFQLHQATERFYNCALLVCSFYSPHVHNLAFLRTQAERIDLRLADVWPRDAKSDRSRFEKLKEAYIKARYSKHYRITEDELSWLGERVTVLAKVVESVCAERIALLESTAKQAG